MMFFLMRMDEYDEIVKFITSVIYNNMEYQDK